MLKLGTIRAAAYRTICFMLGTPLQVFFAKAETLWVVVISSWISIKFKVVLKDQNYHTVGEF